MREEVDALAGTRSSPDARAPDEQGRRRFGRTNPEKAGVSIQTSLGSVTAQVLRF